MMLSPFKIIAIVLLIILIISTVYWIANLIERRKVQKTEDIFAKAEKQRAKEEKLILEKKYQEERKDRKNKLKNLEKLGTQDL